MAVLGPAAGARWCKLGSLARERYRKKRILLNEDASNSEALNPDARGETTVPMIELDDALRGAVLREALSGLQSTPKTLAPWLFYDELGSRLFEEITRLPEYYLTRTERGLFVAHGEQILERAAGSSRLTIVELGAGSAAKTGVLLRCAVEKQGSVLYQPIDVSASALEEAAASLAAQLPGVVVEPQVANYITDGFTISRLEDERVLALYIGSSIGNFSPEEAAGILRNLREHLETGDALLLGADLAPSEGKSVAALLAAYDDAAGVTAEFNRNVLHRLNRELDADFEVDAFAHRARWNARESRMEMHLESVRSQSVRVAGQRFSFGAGETIHTENSYKFTEASIAALLESTGFRLERMWEDPARRFAVTLAQAVDAA